MGIDKLYDPLDEGDAGAVVSRPPLMFETFKATKRLGKVEERCESLERDMKQLELEWTQTYDKMRHLFMRIAKRAEMAAKAEELSPTDGTVEPPVSSLSQRQQEANDRILARRNRLPVREQ